MIKPFSLLKRFKEPILALVSAIVVFLSIGYWMISYYDKGEKIPVVVAAKDLQAPRGLKAEDLMIIKIARDSLPVTAIADPTKVVGVTLIAPMSKNEVLTINHLAKGVSAEAESLLVSKTSFGFSLPTAWLAGVPPKLAVNDRIDIYASAAEKSVGEGTTFVAANIKVLKVENDKDGIPARLLLEVQRLEAAQILQARANRLALAVVVQPSKVE